MILKDGLKLDGLISGRLLIPSSHFGKKSLSSLAIARCLLWDSQSGSERLGSRFSSGQYGRPSPRPSAY